MTWNVPNSSDDSWSPLPPPTRFDPTALHQPPTLSTLPPPPPPPLTPKARGMCRRFRHRDWRGRRLAPLRERWVFLAPGSRGFGRSHDVVAGPTNDRCYVARGAWSKAHVAAVVCLAGAGPGVTDPNAE